MQAVRNITPIKQRAYKVLAVDDDRTTLLLLQTQLEDMGYDVVTAKNGREALGVLDSEHIDVVMLDREMPQMGGMEMVAKMKQDARLADIPVIMQTGSGKPDEVREGIDIGVYYYLTKPLVREVVKSVISAAIRSVEQHEILVAALEKQRGGFGLIDICSFSFSKLEEAEQLATFLANLYPSPERVLMGLAELLINAVEHGNLGIHYNEKTKLIADGTWRQEVNYRQKLQENRDKKVIAIFARKNDGLYLRVKDEGEGFDWRSYMQIEPSRASDNHGRGIAMANMVSFDKLTYNEAGNEVTAFANLDVQLEW